MAKPCKNAGDETAMVRRIYVVCNAGGFGKGRTYSPVDGEDSIPGDS